MPVTFDEILLDPHYSDVAEGGPEGATAEVRSGAGGTLLDVNVNSEDFTSRYEIQYGNLEPPQRKALRKFAILRRFGGRGFRFLAPDNSELGVDAPEPVGIYNSETGEVEQITATDGVIDTFYLIQYYYDGFESYIRRIVKPSPLDPFRLELRNPADINEIIDVVDILPEDNGSYLPEYGVAEYGVGEDTVTITMDYNTGIITCSPPLPEDLLPCAYGVFHIPAHFGTDWHKQQVDEEGLGSVSVQIEELLPVVIGIPI